MMHGSLLSQSTHASDHGHSASQEWVDAVDTDSCVPDTYAQTNYVEVRSSSRRLFFYL